MNVILPYLIPSYPFILDVLDFYENYHISKLRQTSLDTIYEHICADDFNTKGISIGPVRIRQSLSW